MEINFRALQDRLRDRLLARIAAGELTGLELARETGFRQAHISNFLNRKRNMSLEAMDQMLDATGISVAELMSAPDGANRRKRKKGEQTPKLIAIPVVDGQNCVATQVPNSEGGIVLVSAPVLDRLKPRMEVPREHWTRFVAMRVRPQDADAMGPRLPRRSLIVVDRHYNSLEPWRAGERNLFLVRAGEDTVVRYVEEAGAHLVLRPESLAEPLRAVLPERGQDPRAAIVGRVCLVHAQV